MSPEIQKKIFLPFFTTKSEGKGTGLGLSTVEGLANQSGASICVSSTEGQGTTFKLHFPVANGSFDTSVDVISEPIEGTLTTQTTILLAEDDAAVRQQVKDSLIHAGYTILEAMDGLHALELLNQYDDQIQLLITDVLMPRMNGRDLALRISDLRSTIQVLYISGCPRDVITDRGVLIEGVNFLEKPFDGNDLVLTVRQILGSQERVM
jgi:CheY-like chemotaxis protein